MVAAVAGCVSMPDGGPVDSYGGNQDNSGPAQQYGGLFVTGPEPHWSPHDIVQGFLDASAAYPTDPTIAKEYLVGSASRTWDPGSVVVFNQLTVPVEPTMIHVGRHRTAQAQVTTTGTVQATFGRSGQYVLAPAPLSEGQPAGTYRFKLVQVDGQWRIANPPSYRLVSAIYFPQVYQARDLYFVNLADNVLVPDSVFVPVGTSPEDLAKNLVEALSQGPSTAWLRGAADTEIPVRTKVLNVVLDGATAVVDLGGAAVASASPTTLARISAQLVWTLVGSQASPPPAIQSVELEIDGKVPGPLPSRCGVVQTQSPQKLASYECYDPYPSAPAMFSYANQGLAWSRCGSDREAQQGHVGAIVPFVSRTGTLGSQQAGTCGPIPSTTTPPAQPGSLPAMSMAATSPDGKYLALVSPQHNAVYVGPLSGGAASFPHTSRPIGGGITALSWGDGFLWVVQDGNIWLLPPDGGHPVQVSEEFSGSPTDLSIAPDGVRVAAIVKTGSGTELELAAINPPPPNQTGQPPKGSFPLYTIGQDVPLAPNLTNPVALTWYDADDLIVLEAAKGGNTLWQVPVDGQQATPLPVTPQGVISITADSAANYLVAGLTGDKLEVSAGLDGQWQQLTANGQNPVYPG
jgi:Lipoprotein LpqB beta-propeller domain/Sporulation and spore germination